MRIGIRSSALRNAAGLGPAELETLKRAGFNLVELNFNHLDNYPLPSPHNTRAVEELRRAAADLGLTLTAHAPEVHPLTVVERPKLDTAVAHYAEVIADMARYGVEILVVHSCPHYPMRREMADVQRRHLAAALGRLAPRAEAASVKLALETMIPGRITSSVEGAIEAADAAASPWVGICIDTNHVNLTQDPAEAIVAAGRRLMELHLNDNHGFAEEHLLPYEGVVDWRAVAEATARTGFDGPVVLEPAWAEGESPAAGLGRAAAAAARFVGEVEEFRTRVETESWNEDQR